MKKKILVVNSSNYVRNTSINYHLKKKYNLKEIYYSGNFILKNIKLLKIFFLKFDLVLINWNTWSSFFTIKFINLFKNRPIVYDAYTLIYEDYADSEIKKNFLFKFLYKNIEKFIFFNCNAIITDTSLHQKKIINLFKVKKKVLSLNVSQKNLKLSNKKTLNSKIQLVHAGANRKLHNITKMIHLISKLPLNLREKIFFTIIGNDQFNKYQRLITKLKCQKNIKVINHLKYNHYFKVIKNSDICIGLFGETEKSQNIISNFIVTSANLGKVIITKNTRAAKIYLNNNRGIFLLKKPENLNFIKFIKRYITSVKFRDNLKNKSKDVFVENFEIKKNYKKLDLFINKLL